MMFLRSCFLFYKKPFIFRKVQILKNVWVKSLCCPFISSVARILLRRPTSKQSVMRELRNVRQTCGVEVFIRRLYLLLTYWGDWRLGIQYADNNVFFICLFWGCLYVLRKTAGRCRDPNCPFFISDLKINPQSRIWATDFRLRYAVVAVAMSRCGSIKPAVQSISASSGYAAIVYNGIYITSRCQVLIH
jgi:hypothetical protein